MDDKDIEKMITSAADHLPIPWERLWLILQKILQYTLVCKSKISHRRWVSNPLT